MQYQTECLEASGIEVVRGCGGDVEEMVAAYIAGNVKSLMRTLCVLPVG